MSKLDLKATEGGSTRCSYVTERQFILRNKCLFIVFEIPYLLNGLECLKMFV